MIPVEIPTMFQADYQAVGVWLRIIAICSAARSLCITP